MTRKMALIGCILVLVFGYLVRAEAQLTVSAAAIEPVSGWQRIEIPDEARAVWVSPDPSLTSDDIQFAEPTVRPDGTTVVALEFTAAGAEKMRALSRAQINRPIALLVDGELMWAPVVRSAISERAEISGGAGGLTPQQVERILAGLNR